MKVFLSSTGHDLASFREAAFRSISGLGLQCVRMEDFAGPAVRVEDFDERWIAECELFVALIGEVHGSCPAHTEKSYTELEYDAAVSLKKTCFLFLTDDDFALPPRLIESDAKRARQAVFRERISKGVIRNTFSSPLDLAAKIGQAYNNWRNPIGRLSPGSAESIQLGYLEALITGCEFAPKPVLGGDYHKAIRLDSIYVPLHAYPGSNYEISATAEVRTASGATEDPASYQNRKRHRAFGEKVGAVDDLFEQDSPVSVSLILGDPGSGKTTLLYYRALFLAKQKREQIKLRLSGGKEEIKEARFPMFVRAVDFASRAEKEIEQGGRPLTLLDFLGSQLLPGGASPQYPAGDSREGEAISATDLQEMLKSEVRQGSAEILIDGLDEVGDEKRRRTVSHWIDSFLATVVKHDSPNKNIARLTSRIVGYEQAPLQTPLLRFTVEPLDEKGRRDLAGKWFAAAAASEEEASELELKFSSQLSMKGNQRISEMAENPHLLTLLCANFLSDGQFPRNRAELFRFLLDRNLLRPLLDSGFRHLEVAMRSVEHVAAWLHAESANGRVSRDELRRELEDFLGEQDVQMEHTERFLAILVEHSGLMVERGPGEYAFLHRSLQEYLAGRHLLHQADAARCLVERSVDTRWQEPVRLGLGHASIEFNRKRKFEPLLESIADVDDEPGTVVPTASLLLLDAANEMSSLPAAIIRRVFRKLLTLYCEGTGVGTIPTFEQLLSVHISERWVAAELHSVEERAIEEEIEKQLRKNNRMAAQRAARLIDRVRIYCNSLAKALQEALELDDAAGSWIIHRCLQVIVSQKKLQQLFSRRSLPDEVLRTLLKNEEALKNIFVAGAEIVEGAQLRKLRAKLGEIHLLGLPFRDLLLKQPDLLQRIRRDPHWMSLVLCVYAGGLGDFEHAELSNAFGQAVALEQILQADVLEPLVEKVESIVPEFSPDLLYRDSDFTPQLSELLKTQADLNGKDDVPPQAGHLLTALRLGDYDNSSQTLAAEFEQIERARELTRDCLERAQIISAASISAPGQSIFDRARFWAPFFRPNGKSLGDLLVVISAIPNLRGTDHPEELIEGIGAAGFCRQYAASQRQGLLWIPESLGDYLSFALDRLEDVPQQAVLAWLCTWFASQLTALCAQGGRLFHYRVEIAGRLMVGAASEKRHWKEIAAHLLKIEQPPGNVKELWAILLQHEEEIEPAYERARALIALHKIRPQHAVAFPAEAESLVDKMSKFRERAIVLGFLSQLEINRNRAKELRTRAAAYASRMRSKEAAAFLRDSLNGTLVPEHFPGRFWDESEPSATSAAQIALSRIQLPGPRTETRILDWVLGSVKKLLPDSLRESGVSDFGLFFGLTKESLSDVAAQSSEQILNWLPLTTTFDPQVLDQLSRYADDGDNKAFHYALVAAENDIWSVRGVGLLSQLLESENDAWRFRAQRVFEGRRRLPASELGSEVLAAVARELLDKPHRTPLLWFFARVTHNSREMIDSWCQSVAATGNEVHDFLLRAIHETDEVTWQRIATSYLLEDSSVGNSLLATLRRTVERSLPEFFDVPELVQLLANCLPKASTSRKACLIEVLGFLGEPAREIILNADLPAGPALCERLIALGRIGEDADKEIMLSAVNSADSDLRTAALTGLILCGMNEYEELALLTTNSESVIDAFAAACNTRFYSDTFRYTVQSAAKYVQACSENGDNAALRRLLAGSVSVVRSFDEKVEAERAWRNERDFLPIAAALAEEMPARFCQAWNKVAPPIVEKLGQLAETADNFAGRMAAIRLLGSLDRLYPETVAACAAGMFDHKYVREVAQDVASALPPVTAVTGESLFPRLQSGSLSLAVVAARAIHSALERVLDEDLRSRWSKQLTETCLNAITSYRAHFPIMDYSESSLSEGRILYRGTAGEVFGELLLDILGVRSGVKLRRFSAERFWMSAVKINDSRSLGSFQIGDVAVESTFDYLVERVGAGAGKYLQPLKLLLDACREQNASVGESVMRMVEIIKAERPDALDASSASASV